MTDLSRPPFCGAGAYWQGTQGYRDLQTRVRNATYLAGKFWGNANPGFSRNNPLAADSRFHLGVPPTK